MRKEILILLAFFVTSSAADEAIKVTVPYDANRPLAEQREAPVFLSASAQQALKAEAVESPPTGLTGASLDLQVHQHELEGVYEASLYAPAAGTWTLTFPSGLAKCQLNGASCQTTGGQVTIPKAGLHRLRLDFRQALPAGWKAVEINVPKAATAKAQVQWDDGLVEKSSFNGANTFLLERKRKLPVIQHEAILASADWTHHLNIGRTEGHLETQAILKFPNQARHELQLTKPDGWTINSVQSSSLSRWSLREKQLILSFDSAITDQCELKIAAHRSPGLERETPRFTVEAQREQTQLVFASSGAATVSWEVQAPWIPLAPVPPGALPDFEVIGAVTAQGSPEPFAYHVKPLSQDTTFQLHHCYTYRGSHWEVVTVGRVEHLQESGLAILTMRQGQPTTIRGPHLRHWSYHDSQVNLQFESRSEDTSFTMQWSGTTKELPWIEQPEQTCCFVSEAHYQIDFLETQAIANIADLPWKVPSSLILHGEYRVSDPPTLQLLEVERSPHLAQALEVTVSEDELTVRAEITLPAAGPLPASLELAVPSTVIALEVDQHSIHGAESIRLDGRRRLTLDAIIRRDGSQFLLPGWQFTNIDRVSSTVTLHHPSDLRVGTNLEPPYHLETASDTLELKVQRLALYDKRPARIRLADHSSILYETGEAWHEVTYHIENRSLQHLEVSLQAGHTLRTVHVNDQSIAIFQEGESLFIPLDQQASQIGDTKVTLLTQANQEANFTPFILTEIEPERTLWQVAYPEAWEIAETTGNLESISAFDRHRLLLAMHERALIEISQRFPNLSGLDRLLARAEFQHHAQALELAMIHDNNPGLWQMRLKKLRTSLEQTPHTPSKTAPTTPEESVHGEVTIHPDWQWPALKEVPSFKSQELSLHLPAPSWDDALLELPKLKPTHLTGITSSTRDQTIADDSPIETLTPKPPKAAPPKHTHRIHLPLPGAIRHFKRGPGNPELTLRFR